jgi:hypothetical protein
MSEHCGSEGKISCDRDWQWCRNSQVREYWPIFELQAKKWLAGSFQLIYLFAFTTSQIVQPKPFFVQNWLSLQAGLPRTSRIYIGCPVSEYKPNWSSRLGLTLYLPLCRRASHKYFEPFPAFRLPPKLVPRPIWVLQMHWEWLRNVISYGRSFPKFQKFGSAELCRRGSAESLPTRPW